MELALFSLSIETMLLESAKDFPDMGFMLSLIIRKDKYIIKIHDDTNVQ